MRILRALLRRDALWQHQANVIQMPGPQMSAHERTKRYGDFAELEPHE